MMPKPKTLQVAAVQASPVSFDLQLSLNKLQKLAAEAASAGAELIVFPWVFMLSISYTMHILMCD